ncbi:polysaccharide biosynthesis tyrosine autokinase [Rhizobium sp. AQ_MP]|uniref:GumC family protein n=1 Tax=Rhizobium sp. AQ_MP TaxID=2761536 RepID=UPI0016394F00|nr:polysaccharide biosynthesis tyrosine autokinase [Rhizobium sp. AQ_MP]MBC2775873.1 polysaccharide biosynthesis tyrosine autokinase [Rhizobium sp. AQ_MP]
MEQEIDLKSIIGLFRRQLWLMVSIVVTIVLLTAGVLYTLTPEYTATNKVLVDLSNKDLLQPDDRMNVSVSDANARVESEVSILRSDNIYLEVIRRENLLADPEFGIRPGRFDWIRSYLNVVPVAAPSGEMLLGQALARLQSAVTVRRQGLTYIIEISVTSKTPAKAAKLANSIASTYIDLQLQSKVSRTVASRNIIESQISQANNALIESERGFDRYLSENLDRIEEQSASPRIAQLRSEFERIRTERERVSGLAQVVELSLNAGDISALTANLQADAIRQLQQRQEEVNAALALATEGSERAINLRSELEQIQAQIVDEAGRELTKLQQEVASYEDRGNTVRAEMRTAMLNSNLPPEVLTEIYSLQQSSEIARSQYQSLLQRLRELDVQAQLQVADARVVNQASIPTQASFPNKRLMLALAGVFALCLGGAAAILRELFIGGFTSEDQVEQVLRTPLATTVPRQSGSTNLVKIGVADLVVSAPLSVFAESIRRLRVLVERRKVDMATVAEDKAGLVIMVTSTEPNEGKSTTALALARTLARSGRKTLIIDCDLRKPSLSKLTGVTATPWLSEVLRGQDLPPSVSKHAMIDPMSDLSMIFGSRVSDIATDDLLMGDRFNQILRTAKRHFDYIVIDTPPVGAVVDALYLARFADMIVFVLKWASTPQSMAKKALMALKQQSGPQTQHVIVLNQKEKPPGGKYSAYAAYYGQSEPS